jgi:uncharacterized protein
VNGCYRKVALAWLVSIGAGCASVPVRYYTLTPPPDEASPVSDSTFPIDVRVLHTPPQLNRSELLVRSGATEVTLLENERWASPVSDEIKEALRVELQRRLGQTSGLRPAWTKLRLDIDVQHLEAELGRYALFEASWSATVSATDQPSAGARVTSCTFRADERIHDGFAEVVAEYQREIAALAEAIVAVLTSPASGIDASCHKSIEGSAGSFGPKGS